MKERRSVYFVFQGLLTIILLLFFLFERQHIEGCGIRLTFLAVCLGVLLIGLARAPLPWLTKPGVQSLWFLSDVFLTSTALHWIQQPTSDLYLIYFLVIFGTALTQNMMQSFMVAFLATFLYTYSTLHANQAAPFTAEFWLRVPFLWIAASFTAMLSHDARQAQQKQERAYQERLFHMERLAALGQISAEVAHRIKAPLTTIRVNAEVMAHQRDTSPKMKRDLNQIQEEVDRCKEILQKLLELGRIEEMDSQRLDLKEAVRSALSTMRPQLERLRIEMKEDLMEDPAFVEGDSTLIREAVLAVLQNAAEAMPHGGLLQVGMYWVKRGPWWSLNRQDSDYFDVVISDTGSGIDLQSVETIFRPFYTTKPGGGSGLGLSAALRILDKHRGSIRASSDGPGQGARITLTIPRMKV